jgi:hypothetical protein
MDWRSHFTAAWFSAWQDAGLPGPAGYAGLYDEFRRAVLLPDTLAPSYHTSGPLAAATLRDVYTFGVFVGHVAGRLLALPPDEIEASAGWCGRFNLGISLFDYLIDEDGRGEDLARWPPFARLAVDPAAVLSASDSTESQPEVVQVLHRIAADVMAQLEATVGPVDQEPTSDEMWTAFQDMIRAELLMSKTRLAANPDFAGLLHAARAKSAAPFSCMAEWMWLSSRQGGVAALRMTARALGAAIGECFWLVDDARDLWTDLDAGRWNLFLLLAAQKERGLFASSTDPTAEFRLSGTVMAPGWARRIITPVISQVKEVIGSTPVAATDRDEVLGTLAVSIERWLRP